MEFKAVTGIDAGLVGKALSAATRAPKVFQRAGYLCESDKHDVFFRFSASSMVEDWFAPRNNAPFGEVKIERSQFPCLRNFANDVYATVNEAFLGKAQAVFSNSSFQKEVKKAIEQRKQIFFTGQSSGGATAILVTVWFLETYGPTSITPRCVTFGAPLVGDDVFKHALGRENWSQYFVHFVTRYDLIPRVMLASKSDIDQSLPRFLGSNPESSHSTEDLYNKVMRKASCVASQVACQLMGNTNLLLETLSSFIELSPYRPFGTYVFCASERLVAVKNADAVLQILFYSCQSSEQMKWSSLQLQSIKEKYGKIPEFLGTDHIYHLDKLLPLSSDGGGSDANSIGAALIDLGLSKGGITCVRAAIEAERQRLENQNQIQRGQRDTQRKLEWIENQYKKKFDTGQIGYYDSFKASNETEDFKANVERAELAGIFDEVLDLLKKYQLPDGFEGCEEWINLVTKNRRLVEPLDIANYYRHLKNEETGAYTGQGRPNRYKYAQRWFEHVKWKQTRTNLGSCQDKCGSCFWAEVEELRGTPDRELCMESVRKLETMIEPWIKEGELDTQIFLEGSTYNKWWKKLPENHRIQSPVSRLMRG